MLTDEQLTYISDAIAPLFQYLEREVIVDVARRIQKTMTYTRTAELQAQSMQSLGYSPAQIRHEAMKLLNSDRDFQREVAKNTMEYKRDIKNIINDITRQAYKDGDMIVGNAGNMSWVSDLSVWKSAGIALTDKSFLPQMIRAISDQTHGVMRDITSTMGFKTMSGYEPVMNLYRNELDKAVIKIASGTFSQNKVITDIVHSLSQSGLRSIDFASGRSMQIDTASRLAIRTSCSQLSGKIQDQNIKNTEVNLVYVQSHWGARNTGVGCANHESWQGKVYYISKPDNPYTDEAKRVGQDSIEDLWEVTGYSINGDHANNPLGLKGYNCRHTYNPWFMGVSKRPVNPPEPRPVVMDGKEYDYYAMTQEMRRRERNVRALKREKDALVRLDMPTKEINAKIKAQTASYKQFCVDCNVPAQTTKMRYESISNDITKTKAYQKYIDTISQ